MAMQASGPIKFSQLQAEFGGSNPISLSEYYRGGAYVANGSTSTASIPTSGAIAISNFYSTAAADLTPDAVNWTDAFSYGGQYTLGGTGATSQQRILGISQSIQIRPRVYTIEHSDYVSTGSGGVDLYYHTEAQPKGVGSAGWIYYGTMMIQDQGSSGYFKNSSSAFSPALVVANGTYIQFRFTTGGFFGPGNMNAGISVDNLSNGTALDTFVVGANWYGQNDGGGVIVQ